MFRRLQQQKNSMSFKVRRSGDDSIGSSLTLKLRYSNNTQHTAFLLNIVANIRNITNRRDTKYTKVPMLEKNDYVLYKNGRAVGQFSNGDGYDVIVQHRTSWLVTETHLH